jgi:hypothetical protein
MPGHDLTEQTMKLTATAVRRGTAAATIAAAATLLPAIALASSNSPASAGAAPVPPCATSGLVVWLNTMGNGAAGNIAYQLEFTNLSGHKCTLFGYSGVSGVNLHGKQLGRAAHRSPGIAKHVVTLANGATAKETILIAETGNIPRSLCRPVTAAGLRIYPPNQFGAKVVPFPFGACSRNSTQYLQVWPVSK